MLAAAENEIRSRRRRVTSEGTHEEKTKRARKRSDAWPCMTQGLFRRLTTVVARQSKKNEREELAERQGKQANA